MGEKFAMVLSGGGAKGMYQVGVFNALKEYDLEIVAVSGSSIGGINAFAFAALSNEKINELWDRFSMEDFLSFDDDWSDGISDRESLERILDTCLKEDFFLPSVTVYNTVCENSLKPEYLKLNGRSKQEVKDIVLATSALPVLYSRVKVNGISYEDGGMADNFPVWPLYLDGYRKMIAVGLSDRLRIDSLKYPMEELIEINPSEDLGDLFDGTLNFTKDFLGYCKKLGYYDAKRTLNSHFGIKNTVHTKAWDDRQIGHEMKVERLQRDIDEKMSKLQKYL